MEFVAAKGAMSGEEKQYILNNNNLTMESIRRGMMEKFGKTRSLDAIEKVLEEAEEFTSVPEFGEAEVEVDPVCEVEDVEMLTHRFWLRPELELKLELPSDITVLEAARVSNFMSMVSFDGVIE